MQKVFNKKNVEDFVSSMAAINLLVTPEDVYNGSAFKRLRNQINDIEYAQSLYLYTNVHHGEDTIHTMMQRFFPNKYEELKNARDDNNIPFHTASVYFDKESGKLYWLVRQGDGGRTFKIKTETYEEKTVNERKEMVEGIKKTLDKFYGYWYESNALGEWYITDKNKENGKYKVLVSGTSFVGYIRQNNKFCEQELSKDDLYIL